MEKKNTLLYIITNLVIFVPTPPHLAYGLIAILGYNIVYAITIAYSNYIIDLEKKHRSPLLILCAGLVTITYHIIISLFFPIIGLNIGFVIYLIPLSMVAFDTLFSRKTAEGHEQKPKYAKTLLHITLLALVFYIIREFFSFGTLSYPTVQGIKIIALPIEPFENYAFIWSSIPGGLFILAIFIIVLPLFSSKKNKQEEVIAE